MSPVKNDPRPLYRTGGGGDWKWLPPPSVPVNNLVKMEDKQELIKAGLSDRRPTRNWECIDFGRIPLLLMYKPTTIPHFLSLVSLRYYVNKSRQTQQPTTE